MSQTMPSTAPENTRVGTRRSRRTRPNTLGFWKAVSCVLAVALAVTLVVAIVVTSQPAATGPRTIVRWGTVTIPVPPGNATIYEAWIGVDLCLPQGGVGTETLSFIWQTSNSVPINYLSLYVQQGGHCTWPCQADIYNQSDTPQGGASFYTNAPIQPNVTLCGSPNFFKVTSNTSTVIEMNTTLIYKVTG